MKSVCIEIERICSKHGMTTHVKDTQNYMRCRKCRVESVSRRRKNIKIKAIEYKGGECEKCGYKKYPEVLEFHHIDPSKKDFQISSKNQAKSWEKIKQELDKCIILCANCHRETHVELRIKEKS